MKLFIVAAVLGVCAAGRLSNNYLPPNGGSSFGSGSFGSGSFGSGGSSGGGFKSGGTFGTQHSGNAYNAGSYQGSAFQGGAGHSGGFGNAARSYDQGAQILRYNNDVTADNFNYDFETSNGIRAEASGVATNGVQSHGSFGYKGDDGQDYSITYTADENGFQPRGAHLPTPPPIPEEILKSLEQNARDEAAGISDDGTYRGEGAGAGGYHGSSGQYGAPAQTYRAPQHSAQSSGAFSGASSRQYLAPAAGRTGNGNFNSQSGYQY